MSIRIVRAHDDPTKEAEVTRLAQEQLLPALQRLPGFQSYMGCVDRSARQTVGIMTWETEEQATNAREEFGDVIAQFESAGLVFDAVAEVYEVTVQS